MALAYIRAIKDMCEGVNTHVRTFKGDIEDFLIDIGLYEGLALSPFLFNVVLDELTKGIQDKVAQCMLFADDIVLIDETRVGLTIKLKQWRHFLQSRGFGLSTFKTEYLNCGFNGAKGSGEKVIMGGVTIPNAKKCRYLRSIIEQK